MLKTLLALAAGAAFLVFGLPGPAGAAERGADGARVKHTDISSYHRGWHRPYYRRGYWRGYYRPYRYAYPYAYGYGYPYYYRRPFVGFGVGPFGFGVW
jgi:hypothetical protein